MKNERPVKLLNASEDRKTPPLPQAFQLLFKITNAAMTPGIQPKHVRSATIRMLPQPLSKTANGGKTIANKTRIKLMK